MWQRNFWPTRRCRYLDPKTGLSSLYTNGEDLPVPFFIGALNDWLLGVEPILAKLFATMIPGKDIEFEHTSLVQSLVRAVADLKRLHCFSEETWPYDPMIRAVILGEVPRKEKPVKAVR